MIQTVQQIQKIAKKFDQERPDEIQAFLFLSELLKILSEGGIIPESSLQHHMILLDFKTLHCAHPDLTIKNIFEQLSERHNKSIKTIQGIVYAKQKTT